MPTPTASNARRSREDLQALARDFVVAPAPESARPAYKLAMTAVVVMAVAVTGWRLLPQMSRASPPSRPQMEAQAAARQVDDLRQRLEAQKKRAEASARWHETNDRNAAPVDPSAGR